MKRIAIIFISLIFLLSFMDRQKSAFAENCFVHNKAIVYIDYDINIPGIIRFSDKLGCLNVYGGSIFDLTEIYNVRAVTYNADKEQIENIINKLHAYLIYFQKLEGVTMYYFYSSYITSYITAKEGKFNIQVAVAKEYCLAGIPVIYGCA